MLKKVLLVIAVIILTFVLGCTREQKLNESNIRNSINQYNKEHLFCVKLKPQIDYEASDSKTYFGDKVIKIVRIDQTGKKINKKAISQMKILKKNRFYLQHSDDKIINHNGSNVIYLAKYTLTPKGEQFMSENKGVCIGSAKVKQINWYTIPQAYSNKFLTLTKVSYSDKLELLNWAKILFNSFNIDLISSIYPDIDRETILFKTNKGWKDIRYLKRYRKE